MVLILSLLASYQAVSSQDKTANIQVDTSVVVEPDSYPKFEGKSPEEFNKWLAKNISYPKQAIEDRVIGQVIISFVVGITGKVEDVKVLKGVPVLDEEAVRVVKSSPQWVLGKKDGKPVRVRLIAPVYFKMTFPSSEKLRINN
jgi:protein TonB